MVIVGDDEAEVHVVRVIDDLDRRCLVVRTAPGAAGVLLEEHVFAVRSGALGDGELRVGEHGRTGPLIELAVEHDGLRGADDGVEFLAGFDVVLLEQGDLGRLRRRLAEHEGVGAETAPTALARGRLVAVVDGHAEAELHVAGQLVDTERGLRKLDLVGGLVGDRVAGDDRFGAAGTGLVVDDHVAGGAFDAAQRVVVERHLGAAVGIGDHQLDRVAVPRAVRRVLMVIVGDDETEVHVVGIVHDLHRGGLVVRTAPGAAGVLFEEHVFALGARALGHRELRIGEHGHAGPFAEVAVEHDGFGREHDGVLLLCGFDVVGRRSEPEEAQRQGGQRLQFRRFH